MRLLRWQIAILALTAAFTASAYELLGTRWDQSETVLDGGLDRNGGESPSGVPWVQALEEAADLWNRDTAFRLDVLDERSDPCAGRDGVPRDGLRNGVGFRRTACGDAFGSGSLAVTTTWTRDGTTMETDVVLNSNANWDVYSGPWRSGTADFRRVMLHELGHVLGLGHEEDVPSVMTGVIAPGNLNEAPEQDDLDGVAALYGVPPAKTLLPIILSLEEPALGEVKTGVRNLRGWVVSLNPVERVEFYLDGEFRTLVPVGARRSDVASKYPDYPGSESSGFSLALNYSALSVGSHEALIRVLDSDGNEVETNADFTVVRFANPFIRDANDVNLDDASITHDEDTIRIEDLSADGVLYDATLRWRSSTQAYEITDIREAVAD